MLAQNPLEIKHVVEVPDGKGGTTVFSIEDYQRRKNKRKDPEKVLRESPIVLRRVVRGPGIIVAIKLEIHSTELRTLFSKIGYQFRELNLQADPIIIFRPYRCLFFLREELERLANSTTDEVSPRLKAELKMLVNFIHSDDGLKKVIKSYNELIPQKKVTFDILWTIFPPFELVYDLDRLRRRMWITEYTQLERMETTTLSFSLLSGTHTGKEFGIHREIFQIAAFRGVVTITTERPPLRPFPVSRRD